MTNTQRYCWLLLLTPLYFILSLWLSVFPHEYAHSAVAWLYGYKSNLFAIHYGHFNWRNILFVDGINEHVNYYLMYLFGQRKIIGLVGFAGPGIGTLGLYLLSFLLMKSPTIKKYPYLYYFVFWLNIFNLSELLSYVFLRAFTHGDMGHIVFGWQISPWWIFVGAGSLLLVGVWYFYTDFIIEIYARLRLESTTSKLILLIICTYLMFAHSAIRMFLESYGTLTTVLSILFICLVPVIIFICWPTRSWVKIKYKAAN